MIARKAAIASLEAGLAAPPTDLRSRVGVSLLVIAAVLLLAGCQGERVKPQSTRLGPDDPSELRLTWQRALVYYFHEGGVLRNRVERLGGTAGLAKLRPGKPRPVLIHLHGCDGLAPRRLEGFWRELARDGFLVVMPDSFARTGRVAECGQQTPWVYAARLAELEYARGELAEIPWIDSAQVFVIGHSEGGVAVSRHRGDGIAAAVLTAAGCWQYSLQSPALAVLSRGDKRLLGRLCSDATEHMILNGDRHDVLRLEAVQRRVLAFLRQHRRAGSG